MSKLQNGLLNNNQVDVCLSGAFDIGERPPLQYKHIAMIITLFMPSFLPGLGFGFGPCTWLSFLSTFNSGHSGITLEFNPATKLCLPMVPYGK